MPNSSAIFAGCGQLPEHPDHGHLGESAARQLTTLQSAGKAKVGLPDWSDDYSRAGLGAPALHRGGGGYLFTRTVCT